VKERIRKPFAKQVKKRVVADGSQGVKYIRPIRHEAATGLVAAVYAQVAMDFQILPPLTLYSPVPRLLAGAWCVVRETLLVGPVPRIHKEVVATAVSQANACAYCADAHSMMLGGGGAAPIASALRGAQPELIDDPVLRSLAIWAWKTRSATDQSLRTPPFNADSAAQIIGTAVAFHFINRVVDVFLDRSPLNLPLGLRWARGLLGRIAERTFARRLVNISPIPGQSLHLLPAVQLSSEFYWARANPLVGAAFSRLAAVIDELGCRVIPADVRELVSARVARWQGEPMGASRSWVEDEIRPLEEASKAVGRLAMLTALASFQVDANVVEGSRALLYDDDEALLGTVAWAAFAAARRIGAWLDTPANAECGPSSGELTAPPVLISMSAN
jgi:AhpD family alkylhydroperoxidase